MAKDNFKINFNDKVMGSEMTAPDFNQIKGQHNITVDSNILNENIVNELGNSSSKILSQKVIFDELATKIGTDNMTNGIGQATNTVLSQNEATKILNSKVNNQNFLDSKGYWTRDKLHPGINRPQGLRFKAQDNTVFAKTMKALVLGTDDFTVCVVARTDGSNMVSSNNVIGFTDTGESRIRFGAYDLERYNGIHQITFASPVSNSISINKTDQTTNLHHIVITRSGTLVTCTINGRLVKSVTQDRVLDFSNFIYDIANTSYFWGGYVFNYAMTQAESNKLLWNGGRYEEVRLPESFFTKNTISNDIRNWSGGSYSATFSDIANGKRVDIVSSGSYCGFSIGNSPYKKGEIYQIKAIVKSDAYDKLRYLFSNPNNKTKIIRTNYVEINSQTRDYSVLVEVLVDNNVTLFTVGCGGNVNNVFVELSNVNVTKANALLEYRPENIRSDRYLNSGTAGIDYDLVYSPTPPEIIYEKPYKKTIIKSSPPSEHPIAVGQEYIIPNGAIYKATAPPMDREWTIEDFKLKAT